MAKKSSKNASPRAKKSPIGHIDRPANLGNRRAGWVSDAMADVVRELGIKYIVLVPGASYRGFHDSIVNYLGNEAPQMVMCVHEEHAIAVAEGYTKVTGEIVASAVHANVGLMHAIMAIFNTWEDRTPMLIFGANGPIDAHLRRPWIDWIHSTKDQAALLRNYLKWDDEPQSAQSAVESILRGYQIALTPPYGPVYICLDAGLQEKALPEDCRIPDVSRFKPGLPPSASRDVVQETIAAIQKAKSPVLLFGKMSRNRDDFDNRIKVAETLGTLVLTSLRNGCMFPTEHPNHAIAPGQRVSQAVKEAVLGADLIVNFGWLDFAGFLRQCTGEAQTQQPIDTKIISVELDNFRANGWIMDYQAMAAADVKVSADPDAFVAQMVAELGAKKASPKANLAKLKHWTKTVSDVKPKKGGPMSAKDVALVVAEFSKKRKVCLARSSELTPAACRFNDPLDYIGNDGGGGVGSAPGHIVGAALALKDTDRMCVGVTGDGNYIMGVNALWTASKMELPMLMVIANNRSFYNDEAHQHHVARVRNRPPENSWIGLQIDQPAPDMVGFAKAQGFEGEQVFTPEDLAAAMERGAKIVGKGGRYFIDAVVEPDDAVARRSHESRRA
jgi:thiamine pyrophosphate-dependent acetolactate synthase large subunit-like protein